LAKMVTSQWRLSLLISEGPVALASSTTSHTEPVALPVRIREETVLEQHEARSRLEATTTPTRRLERLDRRRADGAASVSVALVKASALADQVVLKPPIRSANRSGTRSDRPRATGRPGWTRSTTVLGSNDHPMLSYRLLKNSTRAPVFAWAHLGLLK
jgi:hypothetical protein